MIYENDKNLVQHHQNHIDFNDFSKVHQKFHRFCQLPNLDFVLSRFGVFRNGVCDDIDDLKRKLDDNDDDNNQPSHLNKF